MTRKDVVSSCIKGYGAKNEACRTFGLHEFIPQLTDHLQVYIEPFFFSGAVFWNVECKSAALNDKNDNIFNFWKVIRDPETFDKFSKELQYIWYGKAWFDDLKIRQDPIGKALFFYICAKGAFNGVQTRDYKYKFHVDRLEKDLRFWHNKLNNLISCQIDNNDFRVVYKRLLNQQGDNDGRIQFHVYADPPYRGTEKNYQVKFSDIDHEDLLKFHQDLKNNPIMFLYISYNDDSTIREWYKDWYIQEVYWHSKDRDSSEYHELLISNRPLQRHSRNIYQKII